MSRCADIPRHEATCRHAPKYRIRFVDGCCVEWCVECWNANTDNSHSTVEMTLLGRYGLPADGKAYGLGDVLGRILAQGGKP